jgi:SAM-dependent methyltransferase
VGENLWDAYDQMGLSFRQHAADSAYNAHYDRPAVLAALGPVAGRQVLDAACGPGLYVRELLERGAEVTAFDASPAMVSLARQQTAGRVRIDQAALGSRCPTPITPSTSLSARWPFTMPATVRPHVPSSAASCAPAGQLWYRRSIR